MKSRGVNTLETLRMVSTVPHEKEVGKGREQSIKNDGLDHLWVALRHYRETERGRK